MKYNYATDDRVKILCKFAECSKPFAVQSLRNYDTQVNLRGNGDTRKCLEEFFSCLTWRPDNEDKEMMANIFAE